MEQKKREGYFWMERIDENALIETDILGFIERNQNKELLRFVTVGSVDDGKSTLIGRLLHDTKGVYEDQLKDATRTTDTGETAIDFARITDGLRAGGSRASRSTWRTRCTRCGSSSSPTHRGTSSTPGTWRPVPRRPTSPSS